MSGLPILLATIAISAAVLWLQRVYLRSKLRQLGPGAEAVPLYRRPTIVAQRILFGAALALPLIVLAYGLIANFEATDIFFEIARSIWFGAAAWGWQQGSVVMSGPNGIAIGGRIYPWNEVEVQFDRDIGQELWGFSVFVRQGRRAHKRRLYVIRENRPRMEGALAR
jgi:hypothetical protein